MLELGSRLEGGGSFNIEAVISPLKSMISTAIMEYHGSTQTVSDEVKSAGASRGGRARASCYIVLCSIAVIQ